MKSLASIATEFFHAFTHKQWLADGEDYIGEISIADAYKVQDLVTQKRLALGETVAGFKVGCTSKAIRSQLGFNEPINARLFGPHIFTGAAVVDWRDFVNCAIEPEMVLTIGKNLKGHNLSDEALIDAIAHVSPGIEIHHFKFWHTPPTVQELICSGGIHAGLIVGSDRVRPADLPFNSELFSVYKDGIQIASAPASEIMGGPLHSLRWLVNYLTEKGNALKKDSLVIPGSPVELVTIDQDTELKVEIERVGSITTMFKSKQPE